MKVKFNPYDWHEMKTGQTGSCHSGQLKVKCTDIASRLFVICQGVEALAGVGADFDIRIAEDFEFRVDGAKDGRVFVYCPGNNFIEAQGEVFTNTDRKPLESGTVYEVRKALREMQLNQRQFRMEIAQEKRARAAKSGSEAPKAKEAETGDEGEKAKSEKVTPAPEPDKTPDE